MKPDFSNARRFAIRKAAVQLRNERKFRIRSWGVILTTVLMTTFLGACAQLGPQVLVTGRPQYNIAVQQTEAEQLLLNIVRQRYNDPILFLDVTSISSGFSRGVNGSLLGSSGSGSNNGVGAVGGDIRENPYIFYAPNNGEKFVRQMLTPLNIRTVALILQAGWSIERVMLLLGESANQLYNRPGDDAGGKRYTRYLDIAASLRDLQRKNQLIVGLEPGENEGESALILIITADAVDSASYLTVCKGIGVACDGQPLRLRSAFGAPTDGNTLAFATRSLFSVIYHLSQHVAVPQTDIESGTASPAPDSYAESSGATSSASRLFHVHSSDHKPEIASVKVYYRNQWFYIADTDQDSKTTFALLSMLITLQSGNTIGVTPLITLPTG